MSPRLEEMGNSNFKANLDAMEHIPRIIDEMHQRIVERACKEGILTASISVVEIFNMAHLNDGITYEYFFYNLYRRIEKHNLFILSDADGVLTYQYKQYHSGSCVMC